MTTLRVTVISFKLIHYKAEPQDNKQTNKQTNKQDYTTSSTIPLFQLTVSVVQAAPFTTK